MARYMSRRADAGDILVHRGGFRGPAGDPGRGGRRGRPALTIEAALRLVPDPEASLARIRGRVGSRSTGSGWPNWSGASGWPSRRWWRPPGCGCGGRVRPGGAAGRAPGHGAGPRLHGRSHRPLPRRGSRAGVGICDAQGAIRTPTASTLRRCCSPGILRLRRPVPAATLRMWRCPPRRGSMWRPRSCCGGHVLRVQPGQYPGWCGGGGLQRGIGAGRGGQAAHPGRHRGARLHRQRGLQCLVVVDPVRRHRTGTVGRFSKISMTLGSPCGAGPGPGRGGGHHPPSGRPVDVAAERSVELQARVRLTAPCYARWSGFLLRQCRPVSLLRQVVRLDAVRGRRPDGPTSPSCRREMTRPWTVSPCTASPSMRALIRHAAADGSSRSTVPSATPAWTTSARAARHRRSSPRDTFSSSGTRKIGPAVDPHRPRLGAARSGRTAQDPAKCPMGRTPCRRSRRAGPDPARRRTRTPGRQPLLGGEVVIDQGLADSGGGRHSAVRVSTSSPLRDHVARGAQQGAEAHLA